MESKSEIRKKVLAVRDNLDPMDRKRSEILMAERILGHQWYYSAKELLIFVSYGSEIDTSPIWEEALRQGKKVYVPCVMGENMEFYRIFGKSDLQPGYKGIPEPMDIDKREKYVYSEEKIISTLMLMPGVAFDPYRNRIGYGKGFYDRYLADKTKLHTIGIGYDCQMVSEIKAEETDIKPMQVICL
ncbi:MAG: 5-formyltetrahydrofolate cyclo-ligase [Lachnospiraceae bacterium]|nr:5-formyltetrahydrofolate cyclo-ligase [Lachnospiraceae bacterium]